MLETQEFSERNLPAELVRRLQVEELWARRNVLAEFMNAERLNVYYQHRAEMRPESFPAVDVTWKEPPVRLAASILPIMAKKALMSGM